MWQVEGISGAEDLWDPARRPWIGASGEVVLPEGLIAGVKDWGLISACLCFSQKGLSGHSMFNKGCFSGLTLDKITG